MDLNTIPSSLKFYSAWIKVALLQSYSQFGNITS